MPESAYTGLCGGSTKHDHKELFELVKAALQVLAKEDWKPSKQWEDAILGIVDAYVGTPPKSVVIDGKTLTPNEYADDVLKLPLDDYVEIMSNGMTPFHKPAELLVPDNWLRYQGYWNVPIDEFMEILDHALRSGYSVAVDCRRQRAWIPRRHREAVVEAREAGRRDAGDPRLDVPGP